MPDFKRVFAGSFPYVSQDNFFYHPAVTRCVFYIMATLMSVAFMKLTPNNNFLAEIGRNTMLFYVYHSFMIYWAKRISGQLGIDSWSVLTLSCFAALIMGLIWTTRNWRIHCFILHPVSNIIENIRNNNTKIK